LGVLGIVGLAALAGTVLYKEAVPAAPRVDPALERAVLPVVDRYLLTDPLGPLGSGEPPGKNGALARGFCTERVIEIRPTGAGLRVGLVAWCGHYVRRGTEVTDLDAG
jgi:hypothetical protein